MNRTFRVLILGLAAWLGAALPAAADDVLKPRIWVYPFIHQENDVRFDSYAKVATNVVGMSLKFSGRYQIVQAPALDPNRDADILKMETGCRFIENIKCHPRIPFA